MSSYLIISPESCQVTVVHRLNLYVLQVKCREKDYTDSRVSYLKYMCKMIGGVISNLIVEFTARNGYTIPIHRVVPALSLIHLIK